MIIYIIEIQLHFLRDFENEKIHQVIRILYTISFSGRYQILCEHVLTRIFLEIKLYQIIPFS